MKTFAGHEVALLLWEVHRIFGFHGEGDFKEAKIKDEMTKLRQK